MEPDPATRSCQLSLDQFGVVVSCVVEEAVDQALSRIHCLNRHQQHNRARGIHRQHIVHDGPSGVKVDRAMDIQTIPPAALFHRHRYVFPSPAPNRPHRVGWVRGIRKDNSLIISKLVQQTFVHLDTGRLLPGDELARYRLRGAILHAHPVQQCDQPRAALVFNTKFRRDPGAHHAHRTQQGLGDPGDQPGLRLVIQAAGTASPPKLARPSIPSSSSSRRQLRIVSSSSSQYSATSETLLPAIQKHPRVRTACQAMRRRPLPSQLNQVTPQCIVRKTLSLHGSTRIPLKPFSKAHPDSQGSRGILYFYEEHTSP